jgi:hypothetical protein
VIVTGVVVKSMGSSFIMLAPASVELASIPLRAILPLRASASPKSRSFAFNELPSVPFKIMEFPILSLTILSPALEPLASVPSNRRWISFTVPYSISEFNKRLSPSPSRAATDKLSSVTNLSLT